MKNKEINQKLPDGSTVLHNAVKEGNEKLIKLLIQQGHSVNIQDAEGKFPMDYASTEQVKKIIITAMQVDQNLLSAKANKFFENLKVNYLDKGASKDQAIDILFSDPTIDPDIIEIVMRKVESCNPNGNQIAEAPVALETYAVAAPALAQEPEVPSHILDKEEKLSAEIKVSLYNNENKEDLINFVLLYQGISDEARDNLINYICDYSHSTALAGQIGADIHF